MSYLVLKKLLLLSSLFLINKLLIIFITQEFWIIICSARLKSPKNIQTNAKKSLFNFILTKQYQSLIITRLTRIILSIKLRGITSCKTNITMTTIIYLYCLEILTNKILFYSINFSECLYSRDCLICNKNLLKSYLASLM